MAGGGALVAAAEGLARDADEAAGQIGESTAALFEKTADNEESNLARTLDSDAQTAQQFTQAGARDVGTVSQGAADAAPIADDAVAPGDGEVTATPPGPVTADGVGPCGKVGEPIDVVGGQMVTAKTDVELPGVLPLVLRRAYASGYQSGRLFGPGWSSTLDIRVQIDADGIHFAGDDAQILDYVIPTQPGQSVMPAEGARWPLTWDRQTDEIRIQDVKQGYTWHFTTLGVARSRSSETRPLTALSDRNGNRIVFVRDEDGIPTEVQHSGGYRVAIDSHYTAAGFRVEALRLLDGTNDDQGSALLSYQYDPRGRLVGLVDSTGLPFVYEYDDADRITAWIDRTGYRFEYTYDQLGRVVRTAGDGGYLSGTLVYDPEHQVTVYTDSLGHSSEHHYDARGHITKTVDALGNARLTESDRYGRLLSSTDPLGNTTRYTLNANGDPVQIDYPDGTTAQIEYDALRSPSRVIGPDGAVWQYSHDDRGNLLSTTDPTGAITAYAYGDRGQLVQLTDALGHVTAVEANRAGLPEAVTDASGAIWTVARDARGRVLSSTDPLGTVVTTVWNVEGLPGSRTFPDGTSETWQWDANGNLAEHTDQAGHITVFENGPFRQVTSRTDPDGTRYSFAHDTELRLLAVTNPQGLTWQYTYDPVGNLVGEQDFNGRTLAYLRDPMGRVSRRINGAGQSIDLVRNGFGQVVEQRTSDGVATAFSYDLAGNLIRAVNSQADLAFTRDQFSRVLAERIDGRTLTNTYDLLGRREIRTTPSGHVSSWQYDQLGQPVALTTRARQISFGHDHAGRETHRWLGADTVVTNEWDNLGRLTSRRLLGVEGPEESRTSRLLDERTWTYRPDNTPDSVTDSANGTRRFDLDHFGRVTAVHAATWTETYAYDAVGNLAHATDSRTPDTDTGGAREATGTLLRKAGRTHYEYDGQGRLVSSTRRTLSGQRKTSTYQYDAYDRLIEFVTHDGVHWRYRYDPLGRRIAKMCVRGDGTVTEETIFTWDGAVLVEQEHSQAGSSTVNATTWDHEPDTWAPVAQDRRTFYSAAPQEIVDEQFHTIITDLVGTPTELVDSAGNIVWRRQAGLWGNRLAVPSEHGVVDCLLGFPGQYHDAETGLEYNCFRYYDAETGRYTAPDPLGLAPAPNHHSYVVNPLTWLDPLGLTGAPKGPIRIYDDSEYDKHGAAGGTSARGEVSRAPQNGQAALDRSIDMDPSNSAVTRRLGVDYENGEIVVLDRHLTVPDADGNIIKEIYHGHVQSKYPSPSVTQGDLTKLKKAGMIDNIKKQRVLPPPPPPEISCGDE